MDIRPPQESFLQFFREIGEPEHLYLMGGFAEDALLDQQITRDREDVDFLVKPDSWNLVVAELGRIGVVQLEPLLKGPAGEPLVFGSNERGFLIELWPVTRVSDGYEVVLPGSASFFRLHLPSDTFDFSRTTLEGIRVQTISPRALVLFGATSAQTRGDVAKQATDRHVLQRIAVEVMSIYDASDLVPDIQELGGP